MERMEELLNKPYWIIDILPERVPENNPGRYFTIEEYWRRNHLPEIRQKHLSLILKLNCYMELSMDGEVNPPPERIRDRMTEHDVSILLGDALILSERGDTYLTVYNPDDRLLGLIRRLSAAEGLFVWQP